MHRVLVIQVVAFFGAGSTHEAVHSRGGLSHGTRKYIYCARYSLYL